MTFAYLASPYTHPDPHVMHLRYHAACKAAAALMAQGKVVFSPIAHSHPICDHLPDDKRTDFDFWMAQDLPVLRAADELVVLKLPGWGMSRGVHREIQEATDMGKPVTYLEAL